MIDNQFVGSYAGRPVLVTGHTGFKGSWLTTWLIELGAAVIGYSLPDSPTTPSLFEAAKLGGRITDVRGDVCDLEQLRQVMAAYRPQIVFHLAAQPIVLRGLEQPKATFDVNAGGTVNVLETARTADSVRALVCVTTDKVYENEEWAWGYRENDRLGGRDPYSASKAMAELAIAAYRHSFFSAGQNGTHGVAVASARAGNVIGGGDFADYRLVPDCLRALLAGEPIVVRNPHSIRPWQHVLESLSGYLWLGAKLLQEGAPFAEAWNFGPLEQKGVTAQALVEKLIDLWGVGSWLHTHPAVQAAETGQLRLSWEKAAARLGWRPIYTWEEALAEIVAWFQAYRQGQDMYQVTCGHIHTYMRQARALQVAWAA
jgi:CDP-glucose 4,6-dehydratase